jgi:hypothetical protein
MDFLVIIVGGIIVLALVQTLLPVIVQFVDAIIIAIVRAPFRLVGMSWRTWRSRQLDPYELNRRRAVASTFVFVLCLYLLRSGQWPVDPVPPWLPLAVMVIGGGSLIFVPAALYGTRRGPREIWSAFTSLMIAGCVAALALWQWYLPTDYGAAGELVEQWLPGFTRAATVAGNRVLPGVYIAAIGAALMRSLICAQLLGGAARVIARAQQQRATPLRPAGELGFWSEMRESFERGRAGHPRQD